MSNNDWTNKLREQLADYQEPVGDDLWADIEQSLAQQQQEQTSVQSNQEQTGHTVRQLTARQIFIRRFSIAAAVAAMAVGGMYVYFNTSSSSSRLATTLPAPSGKFKPVVDGIPSQLPATSHIQLMAAATSAEQADSKVSSEKVLCGVSSDQVPVVASSEQGDSVSSSGQIASQYSVTTENKQSSAVKTKQSAHSDLYAEQSNGSELAYFTPKKRHFSGISVNAYGENGVIEQSSFSNSGMLFASSTMGDPVFMEQAPAFDNTLADDKATFAFKESPYKEERHHHQPISIGVQIGFGLTSRIKLSTGLVYTKTSSEFIGKAHGNQTVTQQDLHYVGIPVNLSYYVWGTSRLHTYLTVGGEGAVNVDNHTEVDGERLDTQKDRMQWSSNMAAGIQYDLLPQLGVYVEPGAKYYFDNGSQIENVFKEKKLNFNFQFGLRWNVGTQK